jgi:putative transposase
MAAYLVARHKVPIGSAMQVVGMSRAAWYKRPADWREKDKEVIAVLRELTDAHRRWGFWQCYQQLRFDGYRWNHKKVYRVYTQLGLQHRRRTKKRLPRRERQPLGTPSLPNAVWALDFMSDALWTGRRFRTLNVLDEGTREALAIEIDTSLPGERVVRLLERLCAWRGQPQAIRCDNGPELISQVLAGFCKERGVELRHIQPGKPNQNGYIERFNKTYREEVLDCYLFENLPQVREITADWLVVYNERRCHDALGDLPPAVFRQRQTTKNPTYELST